MLGTATILDCCISVEVLGMSEDTQKNLLKRKPEKDKSILTDLYMESRKEVKLDLIAIDNAAHTIYIVAVHASLFPGDIMPIQEEYAEFGVPRGDEHVNLYAS